MPLGHWLDISFGYNLFDPNPWLLLLIYSFIPSQVPMTCYKIVGGKSITRKTVKCNKLLSTALVNVYRYGSLNSLPNEIVSNKCTC